jgi:D-threo-aldose 1-dehydrogenase
MENISAPDMDNNKRETIDINLPPVVFGTSGLGNLFVALEDEVKLQIIRECVEQSNGVVVFDSAGKYGAGLALETLGKCLKQLDVKPGNVIISNKLGWVRTELTTDEPTFEPGVWRDLKYDAVQKISYDGIIECFEQGNQLLNGYNPQMVSVHDPDEYLATAKDKEHEAKLYEDILDAYEALYDLKQQGKVQSIGVGAKDWKAIQRISKDVPLDWVMIANSLTIKSHPQELLDFIEELKNKGVVIINSAVFHAGFLVGGSYYDYKLVTPETHPDLFKWREEFFELCKQFSIKPAEACVQFALNIPGVASIALNTTHADRVKENIDMAYKKVPDEFWKQMKEKGLIRKDYPYVG